MPDAIKQEYATNHVGKLFLLSLLMFGFGYLMVPLYDVFCEVAGINGKTGRVSVEDTTQASIDLSRQVTVSFDTNVHGDLPWHFKTPLQRSVRVHPGAVTEVIFIAENRSQQAVVGQAVPSVAPAEASLYFDKTECFCFTQQTLQPGEIKEMPVRFIVSSNLPDKISSMTLSYTFFTAPEEKRL